MSDSKKENEKEESKELQTLDEEGKLQTTEEDTKGPIVLSRKIRFILFIFIVSTELFMNNSSGLLSSASVAIKKNLISVIKISAYSVQVKE